MKQFSHSLFARSTPRYASHSSSGCGCNRRPKPLPQVQLSLKQEGGVLYVVANDGFVIQYLLGIDPNNQVERCGSVNMDGFNTRTPGNTVKVCCSKEIENAATLKFVNAKKAPKANGTSSRFGVELVSVKDGSVRLVALGPNGLRMPDGNLIKFKTDGQIYFYDTINPALDIPTDVEGRMIYQ